MGDSCGGPARGWFQARGAPEWRAQAGQGGGFLEALRSGRYSPEPSPEHGHTPHAGSSFSGLGFQITRDFS
jgi:hypothetical protein